MFACRWIHGQVRLPIPCYDLTELLRLRWHRMALASRRLIRATDSVNEPPGPTQRGMMKRAYETFLVGGRLPSDRSPWLAPLLAFASLLVWLLGAV